MSYKITKQSYIPTARTGEVANPYLGLTVKTFSESSSASGSSSPVDLTGLLKLKSAVEQIVDSPITFNQDIKVVGSVFEGGTKLIDKYITPVKLEARIAALVDAAPVTLDTLKELAAALGDDPNFATTVTKLIGTKAPIDNPVFTGVPKVGSNVMYHAGNLNLPSVDFTAKNIQLNNTAGTDVQIEWWRGANSSWRVINTADNLKIQNNYTTVIGDYFDVLNLKTNTGNALFKGIVSSDNQFLSKRRNAPAIIGNLAPLGYWGLGEDADSGFVKLKGADADGVFNTTNVGLKISGNLQAATYDGSGFTAKGWQVDNAGNANLKSLTVRELTRFYELEISKIRATNGALAVTDAAIIDEVADFWAGAQKRLFFKDALVFQNGDILLCQNWNGSNVKRYKVKVQYNNTQESTPRAFVDVTATEGSLSDIKAGDTIVRWNSAIASRKGLLYLTSSDTGAPNMQVLYDETTKVQLGNISGKIWNGTTIAANKYGLWADGDIYINNGYFSGSVNITGGNAATKDYVTDSIANAGSDTGVPNLGNALRLYDDEYFVNGSNGIQVYDNLGTGNVTITRLAKDSDTPSSSNFMLVVNIKGSTQSPGLGGFTFLTQTAANNVYVTRFVAALPLGYSIEWASNSIGNGGTSKWLTSNKGTGKYEEYIYKVRAGIDGSFSSTNFFYFTGGSPSAANPIEIRIASATVYNTTKDEIVEKSKLGTTIITGGFIKTNLLDVDDIFAQQATIGGWKINANQLYSGTNGAGTTPMLRLSTANMGSGYVYSADRILEGLSLTWHQNSNAGHIVFGQVTQNGQWDKTNFKGIQMMAWDGTEYFCMSANTGVQSKEVYNRIAGWSFDNFALRSGNVELRSDGMIRHNGDKWRFNNDGSGQLAGGNITWDAAGNSRFAGNINALSGTIGGFNIESNKISSTNLVLDAANSNIKFTGSGVFKSLTAGIGVYQVPNQSKTTYAAAYFANNATVAADRSVAIYAEADSYYASLAILAKGTVVAKSSIDYGVTAWNLETAGSYTLQLTSNTKYVIKATGTNVNVFVPAIYEIEGFLGISSTEDFAIDITIIAKYNNTRFVNVLPGDSWGNVLKGYGGQTLGFYALGQGNSMMLTLIRSFGEQWIQITNVVA
jgi:hypothetical protein